MEKSIVKQGYDEAQNSLKERQVEEVKKIVLRTLEKIESLKGEKDKAQEKVKDIDEKIKILKMDVDDLKEGRLDRITERQEIDKTARETSVVIILKEAEARPDCPSWNWPYRVIWDYTLTANGYGWTNFDYLDNSSAKWGTIGTYLLSNGNTINLR